MNKKNPSFIGAGKDMTGDEMQKQCDVETKHSVTTSNGKRVIYVDAAFVDGRYRVGMYDILKNKKTTLQLGKVIDSSSKAEKCAILLGVLYLFERSKNGIVLNDSKEAVRTIGKRHPSCDTAISWIPREINLADQVSREKPNTPKKAWRRLKSVIAVTMPELLNTKLGSSQKNTEQTVLSPCATAMVDFIEQEKGFLPATNSNFSNKIVDMLRSMGEDVKKGNVRKVRNEMVRANIITIKNSKVVRFMQE